MTPSRLRLYLLIVAACAIWFPGTSIGIGGIGLQPIEAAALLLAALWLLTFPTTRGPAYPSEMLIILLFLGLLAQTLIQIPLVADSAAALRFFKSSGVALVIFLAFLQHAKRDAATSPIRAFVAFGSLVALLTSLDFTTDMLGGVTRSGSGHDRADGFAEHPNQFAIWLNCLLPMAILLPKRISTSLACAAIIIFAIFITGSKFNLGLAFILAYIAFGCRLAIPLFAWAIAGAALAALLSGGLIDGLVWAMAIVNPAYSDAFAAALQDPLSAQSLVSRQALWRTAWSVGADHPLIGFGAGQAHIVLGLPHAHNLVLQYFLTHGVFGVVFVLGVFACGLKTALKYKPENPASARMKAALILALAALFAANMSSDSLSGQQLGLLATLLGLISLAARERRRALQEDQRL